MPIELDHIYIGVMLDEDGNQTIPIGFPGMMPLWTPEPEKLDNLIALATELSVANKMKIQILDYTPTACIKQIVPEENPDLPRDIQVYNE